MRELGISFKKDIRHIVILVLSVVVAVIFTRISVSYCLKSGPMTLLFFALSVASAFAGFYQAIQFDDSYDEEEDYE